MVHKDVIERRKDKLKPRGKPFPKGNKKGKLENKILDDPGHSIGLERGVVAPTLESAIVDPSNDGILCQLPRLVMEATDKTLKENMNTSQQEQKPTDEETKALELIETIDFMNGPNKLSIRFSKKHNRMFRIQVFLNDENEIRPVTYSGASTGMTFWNLLKGVLKK